MAEWTNSTVQTVNPGESIVFTENTVPCNLGLILQHAGSGAFLVKGVSAKGQTFGCSCMRSKVVDYDVAFGANIAVPTGQTVGPITVAIAVDGTTIATSEMEITPAAVEEYGNVCRVISIPIWKGCCQTISVRNTSSIPILVDSPTIRITQ